MSDQLPLPDGVPPGTPNVRLVDCYHGDRVDFHALAAAGVAGVMLKATQGAHGVDPRYADYVGRARSVGLLVGPYHFFEPTEDPDAQAAHFVSVARWMPGDIPPTLDSETDGPEVGPRSWTFAQAIHKSLGIHPILYSGDSFYQNRLKRSFSNGACPLWIARYGHKPTTTCLIWQYTVSARIPGEPRPLDTDIFFGTLDAFKARLGIM